MSQSSTPHNPRMHLISSISDTALELAVALRLTLEFTLDKFGA